MKLKTLLIGCFGGFIMLNSCTESPSVKDYSAYVNPFIGTGGHGHTCLLYTSPSPRDRG